MRIAIAQLATTGADFASGVERIVAASETAAARGASLMVVAYATLAGPQGPEVACEEGYLTDLAEALTGLAERSAVPLVVPVPGELTPESAPDVFLIEKPAADWYGPMSARGEGDVVVGQGHPCRGCTRFVLDGARFAVVSTYEDLEALRSSGESLDAVIFASAYGFALDDPNSAMGPGLSESRFVDDAATLDVWILGAASLGGYGTSVYTGGSFALSPAGELVASAAAFEEELLVAEIEPGEHHAGSPGLQFEIYNRTMHLWEALVIGLRDFVHKQGRTDVALVLDGTLGSSVVAALAVDAVGPTHVQALITDDATAPAGEGAEAALTLARDLHLVATDATSLLADAAGDVALYHDLAEARLAALARATGAVTLDVRDKTAYALELTGAATTCAQLAPIGDVYRSDVLGLAHMRNTVSPVLPARALGAVRVPDLDALKAAGPSAEACVQLADVTLLDHVEWGRSLTDVADRQSAEVACAVVSRLREGDASRLSSIACIMVSTRTLLDARSPLGFPWRDRLRSREERLAFHSLRSLQEDLGRSVRSAQITPEALELTDEDRRGIAAAFSALGAEVGESGVPLGVDPAVFESSVTSLFSLLQDMAESGSLTPEGPQGPLTFGSPFSEN